MVKDLPCGEALLLELRETMAVARGSGIGGAALNESAFRCHQFGCPDVLKRWFGYQ